MVDDQSQIDVLIADLELPDKPKIRAAVDRLTPLAAQSAELRAKLESLLDARDVPKRWPIAYVLGQLSLPSGAAIRILLDNLDHPEPDIRWAIALLLIRIARQCGETVPLLIGLCVNGTVNQKRMAIYCLRDLQLHDRQSLHAMVQRLRDSDATVRVAAVTSLKGRDDIGAAEREELLNVFRSDADIKVRNAAAITLASLGAPSPAVIQALNEAAASNNAQLKKAAAVALKMLETRAGE